MNKKCPGCGRELDVSNFGKREGTKDGFRADCRDCEHRSHNAWRLRNLDARRDESIRYRRRLKQQAIDLLGGKCACCGEGHVEFLSIHHVNGDGAKHRKEIVKNSIYKLIRDGETTGYALAVLCMNCNSALEHYGACPHSGEKVFERTSILGKDEGDEHVV